MIRLNNDYNHGACDAVLQAVQQTNACDYSGYGYDEWCEKGAETIRVQLGGADADIHFMIGGTQTNYTVIDAALRPYQSVICADTGHINCHEAESIERTGHKILTAPAENGKLTADAVEHIAQQYRKSGGADYLTEPKLVFLSSPSEDVTCAEAARQGYQKVGLLGTAVTMESDFFKMPFRKAGIEVIIPDAEERAYIADHIVNELEMGIVNEDTAAHILRIVERMVSEQQIEAIVLGCTELPLLFEGRKSPAPLLDTMKIHIDALINTILEE